jgi:hypothetical protein
MRLNILLLISVLYFNAAFGQFDSTAFKYGQSIDKDDIQQIIFTLASDSMLGRNTASEGQKRAENYIVQKFKELEIGPGNGDSYLQEFSVVKRSFLELDLSIDNQIISDNNIFSIKGVKGSELESDDIVFAGYGINSENYNDYEGIDIKGKAVFILDNEPINEDNKSWINGESESEWGKDINLKVNAVRVAEPRILFIVVDDFKSLKSKYEYWLSFGALNLLNNEEEKFFPVILIDKKVVADIFDWSEKKLNNHIDKINSKGKPRSFEKVKKVKLDIHGRDEQLVSSNVLAAIQGTSHKDEWVIISAHYDHLGVSNNEVYNGADDNGSGVTAVLEIAEAFKKAEIDGFKPKRSVLFLLVSGEEKGLLGSKYYTEHPVYSLDKTMVDLNIDMVGRRDAEHKESNNYVYLIGSDKLSNELHLISEQINTTYSQLELDYTFNAEDDPNRFYYRSDHYNFAKNNIPVIFYFNGTHEDYHKLTDTVDKIEMDALQKRAQLVFYTAWYLANKNEMLKMD